MSEVIYFGSESSSEIDPNPSEEWSEWIPKGELAGYLKVSEKTIEKRVNDGEYQGEKRKGRAYIRVPKSSEEFGKLPEAVSDQVPSESEAPPNNLGSQSETIPNHTPKSSEYISEPTSESKSLALLLEQLNKAHSEAMKAKEETIANLQAQVDDLKADKAVMTRQIEAGNTAMVTMREAKKMTQQDAPQATNRPGWMVKVGKMLLGQ